MKNLPTPATKTLGQLSPTDVAKKITFLSKFRVLESSMPVGQMVFFLVAAVNEGESLGVIAKQSGTPTSTASRYLTNLSFKQRNGEPGLKLLDAVDNPEYRSSKMITLTPEGRKLMEEIIEL